MATGGLVLLPAAGIAPAGLPVRSCFRCGRPPGSPSGSPRAICPNECRCAARTIWPGWRCRSTIWPRVCSARSTTSRSSATCSAGSPPTSAMNCASPLTTVRMAADLIYDHGEDLDPALRRSTELLVSELDRFEGLLSRSAPDLPARRRRRRTVRGGGRPAHERSQRADQGRAPRRRGGDRTAGGHARSRGHRRGRPAPRRAHPAQLIANAIDHAEHKPVRIKMADDEDTVAVTVRDYGVGLRPGRRSWSSAGSGARIRPGCAARAAPASAWRSASRTPDCTRAGWRPGANPGKGACFRLTLPLARGHKVTTSPLPLKPVAGEFRRESGGTTAASRQLRDGRGAGCDALAGPDCLCWPCLLVTGDGLRRCAGFLCAAGDRNGGTARPKQLPTPIPAIGSRSAAARVPQGDGRPGQPVTWRRGSSSPSRLPRTGTIRAARC